MRLWPLTGLTLAAVAAVFLTAHYLGSAIASAKLSEPVRAACNTQQDAFAQSVCQEAGQ